MMYKDRNWKYLRFTNSFMFASVLLSNKDITKEIIELFNPELDIKEIEFIDEEKEIKLVRSNKYIRLDVLVKLNDGTLVNVEMQAYDKDNLRKRLRYYSSNIDIYLLRKQTEYNDLPNKIMMMICTFDIFGENKAIYEFKMRTNDNPPIELNDGVKFVILNSKGDFSSLSAPQKAFLDYVNSDFTSTSLTSKIKEKVDSLNYDGIWRATYMRLELDLYDMKQEGIKEGLKIGVHKIVYNAYKKAINNNKSTEQAIKEIADVIDMPLDEIKRILDE